MDAGVMTGVGQEEVAIPVTPIASDLSDDSDLSDSDLDVRKACSMLLCRRVGLLDADV